VRLLGLFALMVAVLAPAPRARAQIGTALAVVKWAPNRALDLLDVVRLRVRVGPGSALELRAGDRVEYFRGRYRSVFAGFPGTRDSPWPRLPVGLEGRSTQLAGEDPSAEADFWGGDPGYGRSEAVFGFQAGLLGLELGLNPLQLLDLGFGIIFLDPADDDW